MPKNNLLLLKQLIPSTDLLSIEIQKQLKGGNGDFIPGVTDPASIGLVVLPSYLSGFSHGGYTTDSDYNAVLSDYYKYIVEAYNLLTSNGVNGSVITSESILYKNLRELHNSLLDLNTSGANNQALADITKIETELFSKDAALDLLSGRNGLNILFSNYSPGTDYYTDKKYTAAGYAYSYLSDHNIDTSGVTTFASLLNLVKQVDGGAFDSSAWGNDDALYRKQIIGSLSSAGFLNQIYGNHVPGNNYNVDRFYYAAEAAGAYLSGHGVDISGITSYQQLVTLFKNTSITTLNDEDQLAKIGTLGGLLANDLLTQIYGNNYRPGESYNSDRYYNAAATAAAYLGGHGIDISGIQTYQQLINAFQNASIATVNDSDINLKVQALGKLIANDVLTRIYTGAFEPGDEFNQDRYYRAADAAATYLAGHGIDVSSVNTYEQLVNVFRNASITTLNNNDALLKIETLGTLVSNALLTRLFTDTYVPNKEYQTDIKFTAANLAASYLAGHGVDISSVNSFNDLVSLYKNSNITPLSTADEKLKSEITGLLISNIVATNIYGTGYTPGASYHTDRFYQAAVAAAAYLAGCNIDLSGVTSYNQLVSIFTQNYNSAINTNLWGAMAAKTRAQIYGNLIANITTTNIYQTYIPGNQYNTDRYFKSAYLAATYLAGHGIDVSTVTTYDQLVTIFQQHYSQLPNESVWGVDDDQNRSEIYGDLVANKVLTSIYQDYVPGNDVTTDRYYTAAANAASFLAARNIDLSGITTYDALITRFNTYYANAVDTSTWGNDDVKTRDNVYGALISNKVITQIYQNYVPGNNYNTDRYFYTAGNVAGFLAAHQVNLSSVTSYDDLIAAFGNLDTTNLSDEELILKANLYGTLIANKVLTNIYGQYVPGDQNIKTSQYRSATAAATFLAGANIDLSSVNSYASLVNTFAAQMNNTSFNYAERKQRDQIYGALIADSIIGDLFGVNYTYGSNIVTDGLVDSTRNAAAYLASHNITLTSISNAQNLLAYFSGIENGTYDSSAWGTDDARWRKLVKISLQADIKLGEISLNPASFSEDEKTRKLWYNVDKKALSYLIEHGVNLSIIYTGNTIMSWVGNPGISTGSIDDLYRKQLYNEFVITEMQKEIKDNYGLGTKYNRHALMDAMNGYVSDAINFLSAKGIQIGFGANITDVFYAFSQIYNGSTSTANWGITEIKQAEKTGQSLYAYYTAATGGKYDYLSDDVVLSDMKLQSELAGNQYLFKHGLQNMGDPLTVFEAMKNGIINTSTWGAEDADTRNKIYGMLKAETVMANIFPHYNAVLTPPSDYDIQNTPNLLANYFASVNTGEDMLTDARYRTAWKAIAVLISNGEDVSAFSSYNDVVASFSGAPLAGWSKEYKEYVSQVYNDLNLYWELGNQLGQDAHPAINWDPALYEADPMGTPYTFDQKMDMFLSNKELKDQFQRSKNYHFAQLKKANDFLLHQGIGGSTGGFSAMTTTFQQIVNGSLTGPRLDGNAKMQAKAIYADLVAQNSIDTVYGNYKSGVDLVVDQKVNAFREGVKYLVMHDVDTSQITSYQSLLTVFDQMKNNIIDTKNWGTEDKEYRLLLQGNLVKNAILGNLYPNTGTGVAASVEFSLDVANMALSYLLNHKIDITAVQSVADISNIFAQISNGTIDSAGWGAKDAVYRGKINTALTSVLNPNTNKTIVDSTWVIDEEGTMKKVYTVYNGNYFTALNDVIGKQIVYEGSSGEINAVLFDAVNMAIQLGAQPYPSETLIAPDGVTTYANFFQGLIAILNASYDYDQYDPDFDYGLGRDDRNLMISRLNAADQFTKDKYSEYLSAIDSYSYNISVTDALGQPATGGRQIFKNTDPNFYSNFEAYKALVTKTIFAESYYPYSGVYDQKQVATNYWDIIHNYETIENNYWKLWRNAGSSQKAYYSGKAREYADKRSDQERAAFFSYNGAVQDETLNQILNNLPSAFRNSGPKSFEDQGLEYIKTMNGVVDQLDRMQQETTLRNNVAQWTNIISSMTDAMSKSNLSALTINNLTFAKNGDFKTAEIKQFERFETSRSLLNALTDPSQLASLNITSQQILNRARNNYMISSDTNNVNSAEPERKWQYITFNGADTLLFNHTLDNSVADSSADSPLYKSIKKLNPYSITSFYNTNGNEEPQALFNNQLYNVMGYYTPAEADAWAEQYLKFSAGYIMTQNILNRDSYGYGLAAFSAYNTYQQPVLVPKTGWSYANDVVGVYGISSGIQDALITGGAATARNVNFFNVTDYSMLRTYGTGGVKFIKGLSKVGIAGSVFSTLYTASELYDMYNTGGLDEVAKHPKKVVDFYVGVAGTVILMAGGPVTIAVAGVASLGYGIWSFFYDKANED